MDEDCRKHIIVTGPEGTGGALAARTIAHVLGTASYDEWDGIWPHSIEREGVKVQHTSLPAGKPSRFPDVARWIEGEEGRPPVFVLTVRDNGISVRSKMRRADKPLVEAEEDNVEAARLMGQIAASSRPHFFFSYEALLFLRLTYLKELYRFLGVTSDFVPPLADANARYLKPPMEEGGPRETMRPTLRHLGDDSATEHQA
jgi:hypothetical protein